MTADHQVQRIGRFTEIKQSRATRQRGPFDFARDGTQQRRVQSFEDGQSADRREQVVPLIAEPGSFTVECHDSQGDWPTVAVAVCSLFILRATATFLEGSSTQ